MRKFRYWPFNTGLRQLDLGDGTMIDLKECPRAKLQKQCIKNQTQTRELQGFFLMLHFPVPALQTSSELSSTFNGIKRIHSKASQLKCLTECRISTVHLLCLLKEDVIEGWRPKVTVYCGRNKLPLFF